MKICLTVIGIILTFVECTFSQSTNNTEETTTKARELVNPYNYKFIIETTPCSAEDKLLIIVHTSPKVSINTIVLEFYLCKYVVVLFILNELCNDEYGYII